MRKRIPKCNIFKWDYVLYYKVRYIKVESDQRLEMLKLNKVYIYIKQSGPQTWGGTRRGAQTTSRPTPR